jgi:hypothetical protein
LLPYLKQRPEIKTVWCPCDKEESEFVKVLKNNGYKVIFSHIDYGQDFLKYEPTEQYDAIITNPPFSIKNEIVKRCIDLGKPWALLLSATCIQSASLVQILSKAKQFQYIIFDKRISYSGDRPPFPSWFFTSQLLNENKFYIYKEDPKEMYVQWDKERNND